MKNILETFPIGFTYDCLGFHNPFHSKAVLPVYYIYIFSVNPRMAWFFAIFFTFLDRTPSLDALSISSKFKNILIHFFWFYLEFERDNENRQNI